MTLCPTGPTRDTELNCNSECIAARVPMVTTSRGTSRGSLWRPRWRSMSVTSGFAAWSLQSSGSSLQSPPPHPHPHPQLPCSSKAPHSEGPICWRLGDLCQMSRRSVTLQSLEEAVHSGKAEELLPGGRLGRGPTGEPETGSSLAGSYPAQAGRQKGRGNKQRSFPISSGLASPTNHVDQTLDWAQPLPAFWSLVQTCWIIQGVDKGVCVPMRWGELIVSVHPGKRACMASSMC